MSTVSSTGSAYEEAFDAKRMRTASRGSHFCKQCGATNGDHGDGCENATLKEALESVRIAQRHEKWARKRAEYWLMEVRKMHGKLAMLKHELHKCRKHRTTDTKDP